MAVTKAWIVFLPNSSGNGIFLQGIYFDEKEALFHCRPSEGVALISIGEPLPHDATDVERLYYPSMDGDWRGSLLYRYQQTARAIVDSFFGKSPCR